MRRPYEDIQNEFLVLTAQAGDGDALKELVEQWQPRFARLAWRLTGQKDAARDVAQDSWVAIVRGLARLDDPASFRAWAYRIVRNKCADWTRKRIAGRRVQAQVAAEAPAHLSESPRDETEAADDRTRLRIALATLPQEQHAILSLHYLDGMTIAEIARVMGIPAGTVKSRLFYARSSLKQAIERKVP
jgi:RNA polymerase sigma-70 factor (ECF subfamily)